MFFFASSVDHRVVCLDAATGEEVWSFFTDAPVRLAPTVADGRVYVGSDDGFVYCLDAEKGDLLWKMQAGPRDERVLARGQMISRWPVRTSVLVDEGVAYFGAGVFPYDMIYLYAVDAETGEVKWRNDSISQYREDGGSLTPQGYLLATDEILYVASGRTFPAAVDRATGRLLHKTGPNEKQQGGTQLLLADNQVLSVSEHHIISLNQREGGIVGKLKARQITMDDSIAYLTTGSEISAVDFARYSAAGRDRETARKVAELKRRLLSHPVYRFRELIKELEAKLENPNREAEQQAATEPAPAGDGEPTESIPVSPEARLSGVRKQLEASRAEYQALRKEFETLVGVKWRTASPHQSALILAGETLVVGGHGAVVARRASDGENQWQANVDGEVRGLAVAHGRLVVSTTAGKIYCFGSGPPPAAQTAASTAATAPLHSDDPFPADEWSSRYAEAAQEILETTGVRRGFCLVLGSGEGRLAYELAKQSDLRIYAVESDPSQVAKSRQALEAAGLYGTRVTVHRFDEGKLPYSNYFANLVVSDSLLRTGKVGGTASQIARHVKPVGGVICLGEPSTIASSVDILLPAHQWLVDTKLSDEGATITAHDNWRMLTRHTLPGAGVWTHQYGNPGNTSSSADKRIRGGLDVLWYGDPGPSSMLNRHVGGVAPLSVGGRMFVQGDETVMAYDAYNGLFLWEHENPGAIRTGVYRNHEPGNMVASRDSLFNVVGDNCTQFDAATGKVVRVFSIPDASPDDSVQWGYLAYLDGRLYGTSTDRDLLPEEERGGRGRITRTTATDAMFAYDTKTGDLLWVYHGKNIAHTTVGIDGDRVFFIDSTLTAEQREALLRQDKSELAKLAGKDRQAAEDRLKRRDARLAVAIDANTGKQLWAKPVDVTDCTDVGIGAGRLTLMVQNKHIVLCGANANGHYWDQFLTGDFNRRRLVVLSADTGEKIWAKDANYRHRPIILGEQIIAEPWAFNLSDGEQAMRSHPLTGQQSPWKFIRPGHHCGAITASAHMLFYRSGVTAFYDLEADNGTQHFGGHRMGCWVNSIPAGGLVLVPEASAGCACGFSLTSTIVFEPTGARTSWGVFTAEGAARPVRHLALNLGAPGDHRDTNGKLWLSYPRPRSREGVDLPYEIEPQFVPGGGFVRANSQTRPIAGTDVPWAFVSGARGMTRCKLPLLDQGQSPATYTVRLSFVAHADQAGLPAPCDVKIQGQTVAKQLDVAAEAGATDQALVREFPNIRVENDLVIEMAVAENSARWPMLCAIEVVRTDDDADNQRPTADQ